MITVLQWIILMFVIVFNIYSGTAIIQLRDEVRSLRRTLIARSDPFVVMSSDPKSANVPSQPPKSSKPSTKKSRSPSVASSELSDDEFK